MNILIENSLKSIDFRRGINVEQIESNSCYNSEDKLI